MLVDGWQMQTEDDAGRAACRATWSDSGYLSKWSEHRRECMVLGRDGFWVQAPKAGASGMRP
jgi:hypothetical protein